MKNAYTELIESTLNSLIEDERFMGEEFVFYIHENEGEYLAHTKRTQKSLGKKVINGILLDQSEVPIALKDLNAWSIRKTLEVSIPVDLTASDVENGVYTNGIQYALDVITKMTRQLVGETLTIELDGVDYACVVNCSSPFVGTIADYTKVGRSIPVSVDLVWRVFDGILANNVNIEIGVEKDGEYEFAKAIIVDGAIVRTRTGDTNAYDGDEEMKTTILQQGLTLKVTLPYKANGVAKAMMKDLLVGKLDTKYQVRYFDNVVATAEDAIEWDMVATELSISLAPNNFMGLGATLQIAKE